jgi:Ala-tRNA(Pro) deacylase
MTMNKEETYQYLRDHGVEFEATDHKAVYNMGELDDVDLPYPGWDAKNLFVRDDKKKNFYLITVRGDKRVDLKEFRKTHETRPLSFASAEYLMEYLGLTAGSVTPLGLLNDAECRVHFYLDREFLGHIIGVHPNDNTATIWLQTEDMIWVLQEHGSEVNLAEF